MAEEIEFAEVARVDLLRSVRDLLARGRLNDGERSLLRTVQIVFQDGIDPPEDRCGYPHCGLPQESTLHACSWNFQMNALNNTGCHVPEGLTHHPYRASKP